MKGIAFCGIFGVVDDPNIPLPAVWMFPGPGIVNNRATEAGRGARKDVWNEEKTIDRGYAVAIFYNGAARQIAARLPQALNDRADGARTGQPLYQLVRDVPRVERRKHEHIRATRHGTLRRLPGSNEAGERCITLQFSVHGEVRCARAYFRHRCPHDIHRLAFGASARAEG